MSVAKLQQRINDLENQIVVLEHEKRDLQSSYETAMTDLKFDHEKAFHNVTDHSVAMQEENDLLKEFIKEVAYVMGGECDIPECHQCKLYKKATELLDEGKGV